MFSEILKQFILNCVTVYILPEHLMEVLGLGHGKSNPWKSSKAPKTGPSNPKPGAG